jgi:hypothetical protein
MKTLIESLCLCFTLALAVALPVAALPDRRFDEYGNICWEQEMARLDNFAIELQNDPNLIGYIIVYDGRPSCREQAVARAIRARNYVINQRGVEWNRVVWRYGGHREELTIMLQPTFRGGPEMEPTPSVAPEENKVQDCGAKVYRRGRCPRT